MQESAGGPAHKFGKSRNQGRSRKENMALEALERDTIPNHRVARGHGFPRLALPIRTDEFTGLPQWITPNIPNQQLPQLLCQANMMSFATTRQQQTTKALGQKHLAIHHLLPGRRIFGNKLAFLMPQDDRYTSDTPCEQDEPQVVTSSGVQIRGINLGSCSSKALPGPANVPSSNGNPHSWETEVNRYVFC